MSTSRRDTGPGKLTGLFRPKVTDAAALQRWVDQVTNWLETRAGSAGNKAERAVTKRELDEVEAKLAPLTIKREIPQGAIPVEIAPGVTVPIAGDKFIDFIKSTRLYRDLLKRLDDPTRFDRYSSEIRELLLRSIAGEAAKRGADVQEVTLQIQDTNRSFAAYMREVTAALGNNSAGIRELQATYVSATSAMATQVTQLEASLGNYYQDGTPGRAVLEEEMLTQAEYSTGLRAQYTLKVQAGGALAGFGIAATEVNGTPSSAFIIAADKFAIVSPSYSGGLTNSPDNNLVPFGVDAGGIYMNTNVYLKGSMKVETGGKTLVQGLRGSLSASYTSGSWSDTTARNLIWTALGNAGSPANNNHLVVGDTVTRTNAATPPTLETRYWNDSAWVAQGVFINGDMVVNGSIAAAKINTRNLDIRDASGNVIFSSGTNLDFSRVAGLGAMATANEARIGSTVRVFNGSTWVVLNTTDFVNSLSKITSANISTFMAAAAIGNAYIGNAAIGTAQIQDAAISAAKIGNLQVGAAQIAGNSIAVTASAGGTGGTVSTSMTVPSGETWKVTVIGFQSSSAEFAHGSWSVPPAAESLTVGSSGVTIPAVFRRVTSFGEGGETYYWAYTSACVATVMDLGAGTHTLSVTGTSGTAKAVIAFGARK